MKSDDKNSITLKLRFGEVAIMRGFLTVSQVEEALSEKIGYRPIGEIVLERGWMTLDQIDMVLEELNTEY